MKNPYDGRFQDLAEDHPRLVLRMVSAIAPGTEPAIKRIPRRLRFNPVEIDHGYLLGKKDQRQRVVHIEAFSSWKSDRASVLSLYNLLLKQRYKVPVDSVILLMLERSAPREIPESLVWIDHDGQRIETPYRTVRLWEDVDAAIAFETGNEALLDWVPWMKSGFERMEEAVDRIESLQAEPELAPYPPKLMADNLAQAAASRYPKDKIGFLLERLRSKSMLLTMDIYKDGYIYQEGRAEGRTEGRTEGLIQGKRDAILGLLGRKFPQVSTSGIAAIADPAALDLLFDHLLDCATHEQAQTAVSEACAIVRS